MSSKEETPKKSLEDALSKEQSEDVKAPTVLEEVSKLEVQHEIVEEDSKEEQEVPVPVRNPRNLPFHNLKQAKK